MKSARSGWKQLDEVWGVDLADRVDIPAGANLLKRTARDCGIAHVRNLAVRP
jgi:hypothetical protein